jgi:hypothetical protein
MRTFITWALTLVLLVLGALLFAVSRVYDMGADAPHWPVTHLLMSMRRFRLAESRQLVGQGAPPRPRTARGGGLQEIADGEWNQTARNRIAAPSSI